MDIQIKSGVNITGMRPELVLGAMIAYSVLDNLGYFLTITSALEGKHSRTSLHYSGNAFDIRSRDIMAVTQKICGASSSPGIRYSI